MSDSYNRLKKLSTDRIDKNNVISSMKTSRDKSIVDSNLIKDGFIYLLLLLLLFFGFIILNLI